VLARGDHRGGTFRLVLLRAPAREPHAQVGARRRIANQDVPPPAEGDEATDLNTVVFTLDTATSIGSNGMAAAEGSAAASAAGGVAGIAGRTLGGHDDDEEVDTEGQYIKVYSSALKWAAQGTQEERFAASPCVPVHGDILLAKLAPGQVIELEAHAVKGIGKDHAKFSPVATAAYRLLPIVRLSLSAPFVDDEADALVAACPMGVFDIEELAGASRPPPSLPPCHQEVSSTHARTHARTREVPPGR
jgi:hypothetical protein